MATRKLAENEFQTIPEGEVIIRVKEIDDSKYSDLDKLTFVVADASGATAKINFNFVKDDGEPNTKAEQAYAWMCRILMNDETLDEVDYDDLPGRYAKVLVEHSTGAKGGTFANVKKWLEPASGFDGVTAPKTTAVAKKSAADIIAAAKAKAAAKK